MGESLASLLAFSLGVEGVSTQSPVAWTKRVRVFVGEGTHYQCVCGWLFSFPFRDLVLCSSSGGGMLLDRSVVVERPQSVEQRIDEFGVGMNLWET